MEINEWAILKDPFGIKITDCEALIKEAQQKTEEAGMILDQAYQLKEGNIAAGC